MTLAALLPFEQGLVAEIHYDEDAEQPFAGDDAVHIVILHRRYIDPSDGSCGSNPDEVEAWERENAREWFTIPLFLYDHSSRVYAVGRSNPFHCPWDSGRVGIVALNRSAWSGAKSDATLMGYAATIAAMYTSWANGECYGYVLHDGSGNELYSCWGYVGLDTVKQEAQEAAACYLAPPRGEPGG